MSELIEFTDYLVRELERKDKLINKLQSDIASLYGELLKKEELIQKYEDPASDSAPAESRKEK